MLTTTLQSRTAAGVGEISRLMAAAVVNQGFRNLLLTNPAMAMKSGYLGEKFSLASDEIELILSIRASNLTEFAAQLVNGRVGVLPQRNQREVN